MTVRLAASAAVRAVGALAVVALAVVALALAGCGRGPQVSPGVLAPGPTTTAPAAAAAPPAPTPGCTEGSNGTVVESTRPPAGFPPAGGMPPGTFMRTIQDRGKLVAGTSPDQLLFGYVNPLNENIEGFDVDLLKHVAAAIFGGNPADQVQSGHLRLATITLAQRIPRIQDGSLDLVADTMTITCARRQKVDFSSEYYDAGQRVLVRRDSTAQQVEDLGGKKVCSAASSTSLDNLAKVSTHPIGVGVPDQTDCLVRFQQATVDAISTDDTVLAGLAFQDRVYAKIIGRTFSDEPYGMAISLGHPEFTAFVNGVLDRMRGDGELQAIYQTWLGSVFPSLPTIPPARYKS